MKKKFLQGTIKRHPDGFGFFIPEQLEHPDVYVPRHSMKGAMTNDKVMIEVFPEKGSDRFRGEILKIVERGTKSVVGAFRVVNDRHGIVKDEGKGWGEDLIIELDQSMGAKNGELVKAEISSYPDEGKKFKGKVQQVIGDAMDPLTDIKRVLFQNSIPHEFPKSVEDEAKLFSEHVGEHDISSRKDLRSYKFVTIDGATAKDFDDAILVETNGQGFKLWVAIADVSHYVKPGTSIDKEAYTRGTSVYFPNFVVPMLPEVLSNGLCSLNPHLPRLAMVAEIQMDFTGATTKTDFYEAVIESKARITYGEAQEIIDGNDIEKLKHVKEQILLAADLAKILMAKRFKEGSLDLEIPETEVVIDGSGVPIDFIKSERLFAHRLIEEMMLSANVAVAKFFDSKEIPAMYRIHDPPNQNALVILERYLNHFGGQMDISKGMLQKRLTRSLQEFEGKPESQILNILTLRSMSQAKYSSTNVGHFGLGFEFYTHFTSPIRRYPDLIVHRLLKNLVLHKSHYKLIPEDELNTSANMLSACEQRSVKAERQFISIKKARFMHKHLGEEFDGIISSVTKFGVFVLLRAFEVDGLIRIENLSKEKLEFDEENLVLFGTRTGQKFSIGDQVKIRVAAADPEAGQVDFDLASSPAGEFVDRKQAGERRNARDGQRDNKDRGQRKDFRQNQRSEKSQDNRPDKRAESRFAEKQSRLKNSNKQKVAPKSKKLQAIDKMEEKVINYLTEVNADFKSEGQKFDPEKHLKQAVQKWKQRNGFSDSQSEPERESKPKKGKAFFEKFRKGGPSKGKSGGKSSGGGKRKSSGGKGKGR